METFAPANSFFLEFFSDAADLFAVFDLKGNFIFTNNTWSSLDGKTAETLKGKSIVEMMSETSRTEFIKLLDSCREDKRGKTITIQLKSTDEKPRWYSCYVRYCAPESLYYAILRNDSEKIIAGEQAIQHEERLQILVDNVNEYLYSVQYRDGAFVDTFHNRQCEKITGYCAQEFTEQPDLWYTMIHKDDRQLVVENLESIKQTKKSFYIEHRIIHKSGEVRWISNSCIAVVNEFEKKFQCIGFILDISEKKELEQKLYHHATTDELTGIYNRREGFKALELCISKSLRLNMISTICYFDINNLKEVNDCLGHSLGDDMLKTMVTLVQHELRSSDIFTRIGGDEFVLIFANTSLADAQNILHRIVKAIVEFNTKRSHAYRLYVSYGFSELTPQTGRTLITPEQLIETADKEMYFYKERSKMNFKTAIAEEE
jgi:diguanylate cyclase (GGDEF)-like protein/PAS domain S-box-containing protein